MSTVNPWTKTTAACKGIPHVVTRPDDEIDFIFPDFFNVLESCIQQRPRRITWTIWNSEMSCRAIVILLEVCSECALKSERCNNFRWYDIRVCRIGAVVLVLGRFGDCAVVVICFSVTCCTGQGSVNVEFIRMHIRDLLVNIASQSSSLCITQYPQFSHQRYRLTLWSKYLDKPSLQFKLRRSCYHHQRQDPKHKNTLSPNTQTPNQRKNTQNQHLDSPLAAATEYDAAVRR